MKNLSDLSTQALFAIAQDHRSSRKRYFELLTRWETLSEAEKLKVGPQVFKSGKPALPTKPDTPSTTVITHEVYKYEAGQMDLTVLVAKAKAFHPDSTCALYASGYNIVAKFRVPTEKPNPYYEQQLRDYEAYPSLLEVANRKREIYDDYKALLKKVKFEDSIRSAESLLKRAGRFPMPHGEPT